MALKKSDSCGFSFSINQPLDCPFYLVSRVTLAAASFLKKGFELAGLSQVKPAYMGVLLALWQEDGLKVVELAQLVGLEPSTMTGLIDRMERDNLLFRAPDINDRRVQLICLSEAGKTIKPSAMAVVNQVMAEVFKGIAEKDLLHMMDLLRQILSNTDERKK